MGHQDIVDISGQIHNAVLNAFQSKGLVWKSNGSRSLGDVEYVIMHHSAGEPSSNQSAIDYYTAVAIEQSVGDRYEAISGDASLHPDGIQYHTSTWVDGTIYRLRGDTEVLWQAGEYQHNLHGWAHLVVGNFDNHAINEVMGKSMSNFIWMMSRNATNDFQELKNIDTANGGLYAHGEIVADACPGSYLKPIVIEARTSHLQNLSQFFQNSTSTTQSSQTTTPVNPIQPPTDNTAEIDSLNGQIASLNSQIADLNNKISDLTNQLNSVSTTNQQLTSEVDQYQSQIQSLEGTNQGLQAQLNAFNTNKGANSQSSSNGTATTSPEVVQAINGIVQKQSEWDAILKKVETFLGRYGI